MQIEYIDTQSLSQLTGVSSSTWEKRRVRGDGPSFIKAGRRVLYRWQGVEAWLSKQIRNSTSDAA